MAEQHEWLTTITTPLPEEKVCCRLSDDNPDWAFIDGEMIKLGALSHSSLNLSEIQQRILTLLACESKDFRLVVHLLRTLQHAGKPQELILALQLLCAWVGEYWQRAWPDSLTMKRRLAQQTLKRFASAAGSFIEQADREQRQEMLGELAHLAQCWQADEKALAAEVDALGVSYRRQPDSTATIEPERANPEATFATPAAVVPPVEVDDVDERAWRQTQLRIAETLCARQPDNPLGFRLRRNAVWQGIVSAPQAQTDGRTPLAAFSTDRMAEYLRAAAHPDLLLWRQVEQSLTLAPYWFDGHHLSADIAQKLGFMRVSEAIQEELGLFLQRLPQLGELSFSDRTPFLSAAAQRWLQEPPTAEALSGGVPSLTSFGIDKASIWQSWQQQGLDAALSEIDRAARQQNPRGRFYCQLLAAGLFDDAGLTELAQQHYRHLCQVAREIRLQEWEPDLIRQLEEKQLSS